MSRTNALVEETLTKDEVLLMLKETLGNGGSINNYLSILKGTVTTWDDEIHEGYIVLHHYEKATPETEHDFMPVMIEYNDLYFMEMTLGEEVVNPFKTSHLWKPTFHKLLPIPNKHKEVNRFYEGTMGELVNRIVDNACNVRWNLTLVPMTKDEVESYKKYYWFDTYDKSSHTKTVPLSVIDICDYWSTPLTDEEREDLHREQERAENNLISRFSIGELPQAEDDLWYSVLSGGYGTPGYERECRIIKILQKRGYNIYIDGDRDSFGWVTRGICIDGKIMCMY